MKLEYSRQIFEKYSHIKFHENPSSRSRDVPCGRTDMKLLAILRTRLKISAANVRITHYKDALWTVLLVPFPDGHTSQSPLPTRLYRSQLFAHSTMSLLLLRAVITFNCTLYYYYLCLRRLCKICRLHITSNLHLLDICCNCSLESVRNTQLVCIFIVCLFIKVKCTLVQALMLCTGRTAHRGSRGIALLFHDHGTRRGWGVSVTPRPFFTPRKNSVSIAQEAGWAPGPVWTGAENLASTGIRSPDRSARSQSLYRLRYLAHSLCT